MKWYFSVVQGSSGDPVVLIEWFKNLKATRAYKVDDMIWCDTVLRRAKK